MSIAALQTWLRIQAVGWLGWLAAAAWLDGTARPGWWPGFVIVAMTVSYAALVAILRAGRRAADVVTIGRCAGLMVAIGITGRMPTVGWSLAVVAVLLDLVDGAVARRFGGSPQGAVLDMETDQFTVLGLASAVVAAGGGAHVLLLPALRYAFVLAMWWAGAPAHDPKPVAGDNRRGRRICACVLVALLAALCPWIPPWAGDLATAVAVALLAWSFSGDARFLLAHRRTARTRT